MNNTEFSKQEERDTSEELFNRDKLSYIANVLHELVDDVANQQRCDEAIVDEALIANVIHRLVHYHASVVDLESTCRMLDVIVDVLQEEFASIIIN